MSKEEPQSAPLATIPYGQLLALMKKGGTTPAPATTPIESSNPLRGVVGADDLDIPPPAMPPTTARPTTRKSTTFDSKPPAVEQSDLPLGASAVENAAAVKKFKSYMDKAKMQRAASSQPEPDGGVAGGDDEPAAKDNGERLDRFETASSYFGDGERRDLNENFRKELEKLQIATIYSLVEQIPMDNGSNVNLLFLTNSQANEVILLFFFDASKLV